MIKHGSWIKPGPWRPFLLKATLLTATLAFSLDYVAKRYRLGIDWQVERCLPDTHAVLIDLRSDIPSRGGLIAFRGQGLEPLFIDGTHMVKILVGLPGDHVEVTSDRTTVNDVVVATGLHLAKRLGQPSEVFARSFIVPEGHYFGVGKSDNSFDSRYFGLIRQDQIIGKAWRLG
ncbi:MAG: signal peptidase I [Alphaproteobacteria bacterium]|nr:signal peptidase I [Alphaproteobacteria bacterium]